MRTWDAVKIAEALDCLDTEHKIDPIEWLSNQDNIVLENTRGDLGVFEYGLVRQKVYSAHYYFKSRGRTAINSAHELLDELFNSCYNIGILMGLTPVEYRAARWMTRRIGFTSYGIDKIRGQEYELFILTKKEFNDE
jgi:hypothetical protein